MCDSYACNGDIGIEIATVIRVQIALLPVQSIVIEIIQLAM